MDIVTFPGFNISIEIPKVAFSILNVDIHWYAV